MRECLELIAGLIAAACVLAVPAHADPRLDPDPAFLAKARTEATARAEPHYDLASEKVPFWARFVICAGQLTAIRDEGRALPVPKDELDGLIADCRRRAGALLAYRGKVDTKASALDADAEIAKVHAGAMQVLPGDVSKLGAETMKKRHGERLAFCRLTRDWYEVQNGLRRAASASDQQKLTKEHDEAMEKIADAAPKPPKVWQLGAMPPAIRPKVVQPIARPKGPEDAPMPTAKVVVPAAGAPISPSAKDGILGTDAGQANVRDFAGRATWSALAECSARVELIQAKTGDPMQVWVTGFVALSAYLLWGEREMDHPSSTALATRERDRLRARVAASWDAYRQEHGGAIPYKDWALACDGLQQHTYPYAARLRAARQAKADREYAEYLRKFNEARARSGNGIGTETTSGGFNVWAGSSGPSAGATAARAEHDRNMAQYRRDIDKIRQDIRAIDRKYR